MAKISVNKEACIGCGACEAAAPSLFRVENGKAKALKASVSGADEKKAKEAAEVCPVQAIKVS